MIAKDFAYYNQLVKEISAQDGPSLLTIYRNELANVSSEIKKKLSNTIASIEQIAKLTNYPALKQYVLQFFRGVAANLEPIEEEIPFLDAKQYPSLNDTIFTTHLEMITNFLSQFSEKSSSSVKPILIEILDNKNKNIEKVISRLSSLNREDFTDDDRVTFLKLADIAFGQFQYFDLKGLLKTMISAEAANIEIITQITTSIIKLTLDALYKWHNTFVPTRIIPMSFYTHNNNWVPRKLSDIVVEDLPVDLLSRFVEEEIRLNLQEALPRSKLQLPTQQDIDYINLKLFNALLLVRNNHAALIHLPRSVLEGIGSIGFVLERFVGYAPELRAEIRELYFEKCIQDYNTGIPDVISQLIQSRSTAEYFLKTKTVKSTELLSLISEKKLTHEILNSWSVEKRQSIFSVGAVRCLSLGFKFTDLEKLYDDNAEDFSLLSNMKLDNFLRNDKFARFIAQHQSLHALVRIGNFASQSHITSTYDLDLLSSLYYNKIERFNVLDSANVHEALSKKHCTLKQLLDAPNSSIMCLLTNRLLKQYRLAILPLPRLLKLDENYIGALTHSNTCSAIAAGASFNTLLNLRINEPKIFFSVTSKSAVNDYYNNGYKFQDVLAFSRQSILDRHLI